ncbi:unnamed protein product, partial [Rotaria sp. Silwood2]
MAGYDSKPKLLTVLINKDTLVSPRRRIPYGASLSFVLEPYLTQQMITYGAANSVTEGLTLFHLCLTTYYIFLFKLTQETDLCIGSIAAAKRDENSELQQVIGLLDSALFYRFKIDPTQKFAQQLLNVKDLCSNIHQNSTLPYEQIIDSCYISNQQQMQLLRNMFIFKVIDNNSTLFTRVPKDDADTYLAKYDLTLNVHYDKTNEEHSLSYSFQYATDLFQHSTIQTMSDRFHALLQQLFSSTFHREKQPIYELSILLPHEIQIYNELNDTHVEFTCPLKPIHEEFFDRAKEYSQKLAVILDEQSLTYGETLHYVEQLSSYLIRECDVKVGDIICQCVERSIEMVLGILAILACGAVYCPLNPQDPINRVSLLMNEVQAKLLLLHQKTSDLFFNCDQQHIALVNIDTTVLEQHTKYFESYTQDIPTVNLTMSNISYIIFTSGSTGIPKP